MTRWNPRFPQQRIIEAAPLPGGQLKLFHQQPEPSRYAPAVGERHPSDPYWQRENNPDYEPAACEHCGGDMNLPQEHGEQHRDWLGDQDWYTDWDEAGLPPAIHRGIGVELPDRLHDYVHDQSQPQHRRARALAGYLLNDRKMSASLGNFWSADPDVSKTYAEGGKRDSGPRNTPVVFHARGPEMEHIETDPDQLRHWGVYSYHLAGNEEVPLRYGAPVHLTGISWGEPGHQVWHPSAHEPQWHEDGPHHLAADPAWSHHEFGQGIRAEASGSWSDRYTLRGPAGEEPVAYYGTGLEQVRHPADMPGPLFHGSDKKFGEGDRIEAGHPGNFVSRMKHVYMTEQPEGDDSYKGARGYGRHVYEVRPTGPFGHRKDARGIEWASEDPLEVIREVADIRAEAHYKESDPCDSDDPDSHNYGWCSACKEHHADDEEASNHENAVTDWRRSYKHLGPGIHRGVTLRLPQGIHDHVHDPSVPARDRASILNQYVRDYEPHLGMHWTDDPRQARDYANRGSMHGEGSPLTAVIYHAAKPLLKHIERDPEILADANVYGYDMHGDSEIPLQEYAPIRLKGISWRPAGYDVPLNKGWETHRFRPHQHHIASSYADGKDPREDAYNGEPPVSGTYWQAPAQQAAVQDEGLDNPEMMAPIVPVPMMPMAVSYPVQGGTCERCGRHVTMWKGHWHSEDDDFMCPDGEEEHSVPSHGPGGQFDPVLSTKIYDQKIDDHGDAPQHGTAPRASDPEGYDKESTEGDGDPKWSEPLQPELKKIYNGAQIGMYPEGVSAGGGPGIAVGPFTAALDDDHDAMVRHMEGDHGYQGAAWKSPDQLSELHEHEHMTYPGLTVHPHVHGPAFDYNSRWEGGDDAFRSTAARLRKTRIVHDPEGMKPPEYEDSEEELPGPFYTGSRSRRLRPGSKVHTGMPTNPWGDEGPRSQYVHLTTSLSDAALYAERAGGHVYEVEPDGLLHHGYGSTEYKSKDPFTVVRRVDPSQHQGARVPWTGHERDHLHSWQDVPTGSEGDWVNRSDFTNKTPLPPPDENALLPVTADDHERWRDFEPWEQLSPRQDRSYKTDDTSGEYDPEEWTGEADPNDHRHDRRSWTHHTLSSHHDGIIDNEASSQGWARTVQAGRVSDRTGRLSGSGFIGEAAAADPRDETWWRDHLLRHHGWTPAGLFRTRQRGQSLGSLHEDLHASGYVSHSHDDPNEIDRARELADRFGHPFPGDRRSASPAQGGTAFEDPRRAIERAVPVNVPETFAKTQTPQRLSSLEPTPRAFLLMTAASTPPPQEDSEEQPSADEGGEDGQEDQQAMLDDPALALPPVQPGPAVPGAFETPAAATEPDLDPYSQRGMSQEQRKEQALRAFTASAASPSFRFHFHASWRDVQDKAKRLRSTGSVKIVHASAGTVLGEVRGDHATYEAGVQSYPGRPQSTLAWSCGCPWATFHQNQPRGLSRYAGRMCSHALAVRYEAQSRGMFGKTVRPDQRHPQWQPHDVVVKSWPPYEGEPHRGRWREQLMAPAASKTAAYVPPIGPEHLLPTLSAKTGAFLTDDEATPSKEAALVLATGEQTANTTDQAMEIPFGEGIIPGHPFRWGDAVSGNGMYSPHSTYGTPWYMPAGTRDRARGEEEHEHERGPQMERYRHRPGAEPETSEGMYDDDDDDDDDEDDERSEALDESLRRIYRLPPRHADQANAPWGAQNVVEHLPQRPYGATSPPEKDRDPGSYGPLSGPDPENWGEIQDGSFVQQSLSNEGAMHSAPAVGATEWQETFPYPDASNTAGPSASISPGDPQGIRMEESLDDSYRDPSLLTGEDRQRLNGIGDAEANRLDPFSDEHEYIWGFRQDRPHEEMRYGQQAAQAAARDHGADAVGRGHDVSWEHEHGWGDPAYAQSLRGTCRNCGGSMTVSPGSSSSTAPHVSRDIRSSQCQGPGTAWQAQMQEELLHERMNRAVGEFGQQVKDNLDRQWLKDQGLDSEASLRAAEAAIASLGEPEQPGGAIAELKDEPDAALDPEGLTGAADGTMGGDDAGSGDAAGPAEISSWGARRSGTYKAATAYNPDRDPSRTPAVGSSAQYPDESVTQQPGAGSMDDSMSPSDPSIQTVGYQQWSGDETDQGDLALSGHPSATEEGALGVSDGQLHLTGKAAALYDPRGTSAVQGDGDIAAAARQYLATGTISKQADVLPPHEAQELIREGTGSRARNLELLDIKGTHYQDAPDDIDNHEDDVIWV